MYVYIYVYIYTSCTIVYILLNNLISIADHFWPHHVYGTDTEKNIAWNLVAHEAAVPERPMVVPLDPLGMVLRDGFAAKFTKDQPVLSPWFPSFPWFFDCRCWWYVMVCPYLSMMKSLSLLVEQNKCKRSSYVPDCSSYSNGDTRPVPLILTRHPQVGCLTKTSETPSVIPAIDILRGRRVFLMPLRWFCRAWRLERGWNST